MRLFVLKVPTATQWTRLVTFENIALFLFFFLLSADQLHIPTRLFRLKFNLFYGLIFLLFLFLRKYSLKMNKKFFLPVLWIGISLCISFLFSPDLLRAFWFIPCYLFYFFIFFALPFTLVQHMNEEHFFTIYFLSFWVTGIYAIFQLLLFTCGIKDPFVPHYVAGVLVRPNAFNHEPSFYVLYMSLLILYLQTIYLIDGSNKWKTLTSFLLIILSFTTSAFAAFFLFAALGWLLYKHHGFFRRWATLFFSCAIAWIVVVSSFWESFKLLVFKISNSSPFEHVSVMTRWQGIVKCLQIFLEHPLFGVGYGGVGPYLYREAHSKEINQTVSLDYTLLEIAPFDPAMY